ncbi:MAG: polyprenol monophosphomannose synthase [Candidatus Methanomethylicus sp.]|nr:polyprenol monophosphomannose synthase [Candidatus Methanomethylicus sp.]
MQFAICDDPEKSLSPPELSVVLPTFNERENIIELIEGIFESLDGREFEIVVVDDGSPDGTAELCDQVALTRPNVRVIRRSNKNGLASAVIDGIIAADSELVAVMDADMQHPHSTLPKLLQMLNDGYDVAIGSRYVEGGAIEGWTLWRRSVSKGAIRIAHALLPESRKVKDPMSGFFALKKSALNGIEFDLLGFKILLELLIKGDYGRIAEVPYAFASRHNGDSKLSWKEYVNFLRLIRKLRKCGAQFEAQNREL